MNLLNSLEKRRSIYEIGKRIPIRDEELYEFIENATELVPDAFDMKSSMVLLVVGEKHERLWDGIYEEFEGKVPREKIDSFKNGHGTVLYFYDSSIVESMQENFPSYSDNFPVWAKQASGMLQIIVWTGLKELNIGASLQHYNPVIDKLVRNMFDIDEKYILNAQMPFGEILSEPGKKEKEDISKRVKIVK